MNSLPDSKLLDGMKEVGKDSEQIGDKEASQLADLEFPSGGARHNGKSITAKSHFLPAPGLPTVSNKLAQKIWKLEFVDMEEFLPSNKTINALENPIFIQDGIVGALQQLQQPKKRVADVLTWIRCFMLYIAVMAAKHHDLVGPMISHMHTVMRLQATYGGMSWLQYDWRSRREMNAEGGESWQNVIHGNCCRAYQGCQRMIAF